MEKLKAVFHVLDKKFVRLQRLYDIRWLCRLQAVKAVVTTYETLIVYFENESNNDVTADGLAKQLKSYRFALTIHFLYDILSTLGHLSTLFQTMGYQASKAHGKVDEVIRALSGRYLQGDIRWGPHAAQCITKIQGSQLAVDTGRMTATEVMEIVKGDVINLVNRIIDNLKARFPNTELIEATRIFYPKNIPTSDKDRATYGEHELGILTAHYSEFIDYSSCLLEWDTLKEYMLSSYKECNLVEFGLKLTTDEALYIHYPSLSKLAEIVLLYPASTAEVERGFSFQNAIKTKFRTGLVQCI